MNTVADFNAWVAGGIQNPPVVVLEGSSIVSGTPYITTGTVNAVHLLFTTAAPEDVPGAADTTLLDFISNVDRSRNDRFIATGHSLGGGALSHSLALALVSSGAIPGDSTLTYLSAGPSPENTGFTELFVKNVPPRKSDTAKNYEGWNLNLVNTLNIVPQVWNPFKSLSPKQNLGNIPTAYGEPALDIVYFIGTPPAAPPKSLEEFLQIAVPQLQQAYFDEVGFVIPTLSRSDVSGLGLVQKTEGEILFNDPIITGLEWAREHPEEAQKEIEKAKGTEEIKGRLSSAVHKQV